MTEPAAEAAIRVACRELHLPTIAAEAARIADSCRPPTPPPIVDSWSRCWPPRSMSESYRRRARRLHEARFPRMKRLEDFDCTVAPGVPPTTVAALQAGALRRRRPSGGAARRLRHRQEPPADRAGRGSPARAAAGSVTPPPPRWSTSWSRPPANASCHARWPATAATTCCVSTSSATCTWTAVALSCCSRS